MALLERDHELAVLRRSVAHARSGEGGGVAVSGASGTGKSTLLEAVTRDAAGTRVLRGACDPLRTPRPLGPFRDIAGDAGLGTLVGADHEGMLSQVCEDIFDALRTTPTMLVVEDVHWIDQASAEVLRFLVRRVETMPLALFVSYRDHEVGPRHAARALLGDFARTDGLAALKLHPLSVAGVGAVVAGTGLDPEKVHAVTGGNPFFVTEVAKEPQLPLPSSVRDAVLARTADVDLPDLEVLQLAATAPDRLDDRLLPALGIDLPTLRRLDATGLLERTRGGLTYRHELARQAVESTIPTGGEPRLHARLLEALERIGFSESAVLAHHAVEARDVDRAARYATAAGEEAGRAGAHSEAAAFYQTALDHLDGSGPAGRAELLHRLSVEQYMTSRLTDAVATVRAAIPMWEQVGEWGRLSAAHETCAVFEYYNARRREAERQADLAADIAAGVSDPAALLAARTRQGFLAYLRSDVATAHELCGIPARRSGRGHAPAELTLRAGLVDELARLLSGHVEARDRVLELVEDARGNGWDELASTGYSQVVSLDVEHHRLRSAAHVLDESLPFTVTREIPICRHWQTSVRSRLHFAQGLWDASIEDAEWVLGEDGMPVATLWPHLVTGLVALRRGEGGDPTRALERAWELANRIDETLRMLAVLSALAESMWMTGIPDDRVAGLTNDDLDQMASIPGSGWALGELLVWLDRLDLLSSTHPSAVAAPWAARLDGRFHDAGTQWRELGEPFAEAMSLADSPDPRLRVRGVELLDRLGATATADRHRASLRRDGVEHVPPRPRAATRANPGGLTNRQLEVARLVARGFTNAEIASRLYISPKTADHHVSAVLARLDLPNRRAVVVRADALGLD